MRMADLAGASGRLRKSLRTLRLQWDEAREGWNDPVSQQFEEQHLEELERSCRQAVEHIERLAQVMAKAYHDCR